MTLACGNTVDQLMINACWLSAVTVAAALYGEQRTRWQQLQQQQQQPQPPQQTFLLHQRHHQMWSWTSRRVRLSVFQLATHRRQPTASRPPRTQRIGTMTTASSSTSCHHHRRTLAQLHVVVTTEIHSPASVGAATSACCASVGDVHSARRRRQLLPARICNQRKGGGTL